MAITTGKCVQKLCVLCFVLLSFFRHALFYAASSFILSPPLCCPISTPDVSISWPFYGPETDVAPPPINWTIPFCSPCFRLEPLAIHIRFDLFNLAKIQVNSLCLLCKWCGNHLHGVTNWYQYSEGVFMESQKWNRNRLYRINCLIESVRTFAIFL